MADARHPLVPPHGSHAAPDLVRQRLKSQSVVRRRQTARNRRAGAFRRLRLEQDFDPLFEAPFQDTGAGGDRDEPAMVHARLVGEIEPVDRVEEKLRAHPRVQVIARPPEFVERGARVEEGSRAGRTAEAIERSIPDFRILGPDDADQLGHACCPSSRRSMLRRATASRSCDSTSSRSRPLNARANWARSSPYFTPTSYRRLGVSSARYCSCLSNSASTLENTVGCRLVRRRPKISITAGVSTCMPKKHR